MASGTEPISAVDALDRAEHVRHSTQRVIQQRAHEPHGPATAPVVRPAREYVASAGDSWWSIASRVSPSPAPHDVLRALHAIQLLNPHLSDLTPGTRLHLPDLTPQAE